MKILQIRRISMADQQNPYEADDTGHEWDGIRELKNPPPKWWKIGLHASWIVVLIYCILYPAVPLLRSATGGVLGWTQIKEYKQGLEEIEMLRAPFEAKLTGMTAHQILEDPELSHFTQTAAKVLFGDNCAPCHGAGGQGAPNFPILADDDWLYGGRIGDIKNSITLGRKGNMPAHGKTLSKKEIDDVVKYVMTLSSGQVYQPGRDVFMGQTQGKAICFACHGADAGGMTALGSANLTDHIRRFPDTEDDIRYTITHGVNDMQDPMTRKATMPTFGKKLSPEQIKKLSVYVYRFGGGQKE
jgi:cytochrome c oxidase cbb3-type subunit 3